MCTVYCVMPFGVTPMARFPCYGDFFVTHFCLSPRRTTVVPNKAERPEQDMRAKQLHSANTGDLGATVCSSCNDPFVLMGRLRRLVCCMQQNMYTGSLTQFVVWNCSPPPNFERLCCHYSRGRFETCLGLSMRAEQCALLNCCTHRTRHQRERYTELYV